MATENTNSVYIKWTIDQEAFLKAFPGAKSVEIGATQGFAFINYDDQPPVDGTHSASVPITFTVQPRTSQRRPTLAERFADHTKIVCEPNVAQVPLPADAQLVTIVDQVNPKGSGRIYKKFDYATKHVQSIQFQPKFGSEILSDCTIANLDLKVISITVLAKEDRVTTLVRVLYKKTGQIGNIVLRRITNEDGTEAYSRRCFNVLVNPDDAKKGLEDIVDVQFISVESITVDPTTGLWSDLKLAIDETKVPLSAYRLGMFSPKRRRTFGGRFNNRRGRFQGGRRGGRFRRPAPRRAAQ